jgi:hypothetical protein
MKTIAMELCITVLCAAFAVCACVIALNDHVIAGEERSGSHPLYLFEMGSRLDCYFTIESIKPPGKVYRLPDGQSAIERDDNDPILDGLVTLDLENATNVDALVSLLNKVSITGSSSETIHLVASKIEHNKPIIMIRDARLKEVAGYVLNKKVSVEYDGNPNGLVTLLSTKDPLIQLPHPSIVSSAVIGGGDYYTPIKVAVRDTPIRDLLTECIPLSGYSRIIWVSYTDAKAKSPVVTVEFYGRDWGKQITLPRQ